MYAKKTKSEIACLDGGEASKIAKEMEGRHREQKKYSSKESDKIQNPTLLTQRRKKNFLKDKFETFVIFSEL